MRRLIDISRTIHTGLPVWPGDPAVDFALRARRVDGAGSNVGALAMSVHAGTHADAFFHYDNDGATIDQLDPAIFVGPCVVLAVGHRPAIGRSRPATDVDRLRHAIDQLKIDPATLPPRVLLKTDAWLDDAAFPSDFPGVEPAVVDWLGDRGVVLLGLDVPSIDAMDTDGLPAHLACGRAKITIVESLDLRAVRAGLYELIALPLKIAGGDGSPLRAVLREMA